MVTMVAERPLTVRRQDKPGAAPGRIRTAETGPARLTRRGRVVVTGVSVLLVGLLSAGLATAAQAAHGGSAAPGRYVSRVMVQPGQSLWSLAQEYDPGADARLAVQQIQQLNSMSGDQVQAGAVLWVPRS